MKNIKQANKDLSELVKRLEQNIIKAQSKSADKIKKDVQKRAPSSSGKYYDSIKRNETRKENETIKTNIYTDLKSEDGYFIGRMIENGTGIYALQSHIGHTKTFVKSGYQYWYIPAEKVERPIGKLININGIDYYVANAQKPKLHWQPALDENIEIYKESIIKAVKETL